MSFPVLFLVSAAAVGVSGNAYLRNATDEAFGPNVHWLPMAFGDFNADKLTDLFVVHPNDHGKMAVLLAKSHGAFSIGTGQQTYFDDVESDDLRRRNGLLCNFNNHDVLSVAPADLDGDGGMDVAVVTRSLTDEHENGKLTVFILWGDHNQANDSHRLVCSDETHFIEMDSEPIVMDGNGDNIADLYGAINNSRGIWMFSSDRKQEPHLVTLDNSSTEFSSPHSNAFVDLNGDGNADIFVINKDNTFELWENKGAHDEHFTRHMTDHLPPCTVRGQAVFADFNLDGRIDMLYPCCVNPSQNCNSLYLYEVETHWEEKLPSFQLLPIDLGNWLFDFPSESERDEENPYKGITPRIGDINLDGFPDVLIRLRPLDDARDGRSEKRQMHLLLNVRREVGGDSHQRTFQLQPQVMESMDRTVMAAFYDLYENGLEDILVVRHDGDKKFHVEAYANITQDSDAYFVKVIVLSGICYKNCPGDHIQVPYGTNLPGQKICYQMQRPGPQGGFVDVRSCAAQLTQTANHAMQLPYSILGLGMAPNFIDFMTVHVTNASAGSKSHEWPQIIPNSQLYVIPHPPDNPSAWAAKLYITPGKSILLTGLSLVGTCVLCFVIIALLHWRERRNDRMEKLQEANRFHFDAM